MLEVNLVADLLIAMLEGIKSKKQVKKYYDEYEKTFDHDTEALENDFDQVIIAIEELYPEGTSDTEFRRPHLFYSLFTAMAHRTRGVPNLPTNLQSTDLSLQAARSKLERVDELFAADNAATLTKQEQQFLTDSRRATTDEKVRVRRADFLLNLMS